MAIAGQLEIQLLANIARLQTDMDKAKSVVTSTMGGIDKAVGVAKTALGALGIGLSVNYFAKMIQGSIDAQDGLAKMSQRVGVSVESLNGLGHAANLSGTSLDTVQKALKTVSGGMVDAQRGMAGAKENFAALGISVTDSTGALKSADAVMIEVAEKFAHMKDGTEKAAIATKLFGRAGMELIPMLNEGSAGLAAMVREGQKLNPITTASAAQAEIYNDNMDRLKTTMAGFTTQLAQSALPTLVSWTDALMGANLESEKMIGLQNELHATIGTKTTADLVKMSLALNDQIEPLKKQIDMFERLGDSQSPAYKKMREELERLTSEQSLLTAQLTKIRGGYVPVTAATEDLTEASEALVIVTAEETAEIQAQAKALAEHRKKVADTIAELAGAQAQLHMTGREQAIYTAMVKLGSDATIEEQRNIAALTGSLYDQETALKVAAEEWDALVRELDALGKKQVADAQKAAADVVKAQEDAAKQSADEWRDFRNSFSDSLADMLMDGGNVFDDLGKSFERMLYKMAADLIASGVLNWLTGGKTGGFSVAESLATSGTTGALVSAGLSKFAPGLAASLGLGGTAAVAGIAPVASGAAYGSMLAGAGQTGMMAGIYSGTGISAGAGATTAGAGAGIMGTVGAAVPWIAAAYALYSIFKHDETPSHNAGFLLNAVPGAKTDQMFSVDPFASGVAPVGFNRRVGQSDSMAIIDAFRDDDARITSLLRGINPKFSASSMSFNGYDEAGLGSGRFIGSAWEEGRPGTALDVQRDSYARQLIAQAAGFLDGEVLNRVLGAGNTEAMIAELEKAIGMTDGVTDATKNAAKATSALTREQEQLLDQLYPLRRQTREYNDDLKLLQGVYGEGTTQYIDAVGRLKNAYKDLFPATSTAPLINQRTGMVMSVDEKAWLDAIEASNVARALGQPMGPATPSWASPAPIATFVPPVYGPPTPAMGPPSPDGLKNPEPTVATIAAGLANMQIALNTIVANTGQTGRALDEAVRTGGGSLSVVVA